jgi:hypothetical protein
MLPTLLPIALPSPPALPSQPTPYIPPPDHAIQARTRQFLLLLLETSSSSTIDIPCEFDFYDGFTVMCGRDVASNGEVVGDVEEVYAAVYAAGGEEGWGCCGVGGGGGWGEGEGFDIVGLGV